MSHDPTPTPEALPKGFNSHRDAKADIAAALARAKVDKRPVLLDFGADWCPNCMVVEHAFRTTRVLPVVSRFHVVAVDVGRFDRNLDLGMKYGVNLKSTGIPALAVLTPAGKCAATIDGRPFPDTPGIPVGALVTFLKHFT